MKTVTKDGVTNVVAQNEVIIPDLTIKDLLSALPSVRHFPLFSVGLASLTSRPLFSAHCFKRSALRSSLYM
jgi:omega-6 fatty acid desaturase (delta-12 desaturase)